MIEHVAPIGPSAVDRKPIEEQKPLPHKMSYSMGYIDGHMDGTEDTVREIITLLGSEYEQRIRRHINFAGAEDADS